ncbi:unnamed protein product [Chondrus crispus]|uniref:Uncharacterized protein n=1 Tax=Chondrus crispus TaxID=2769 RepID=R7QNG7_CHOCR|nr:unnamed protein product [Chondrus crispus]CDF38930.1 unnamed protein product [Chondrus crispus]|eukprot:XP_005718835.1 unnamed protein product [Chondrus crispus]
MVDTRVQYGGGGSGVVMSVEGRFKVDEVFDRAETVSGDAKRVDMLSVWSGNRIERKAHPSEISWIFDNQSVKIWLAGDIFLEGYTHYKIKCFFFTQTRVLLVICACMTRFRAQTLPCDVGPVFTFLRVWSE